MDVPMLRGWENRYDMREIMLSTCRENMTAECWGHCRYEEKIVTEAYISVEILSFQQLTLSHIYKKHLEVIYLQEQN